MPYFESGAKDALRNILTTASAELVTAPNIPDFQIILLSSQLPQSLRNLTAAHVNTLIKVPGIVISCSKIRAKANVIAVRCTKCGCVKVR